MKLQAFLASSHLSQTELAKRAGTTQKTISLLANDDGQTNLATGVRIEQATLGMVRAEDLPLHPDDRAALRYLRPNGRQSRRA